MSSIREEEAGTTADGRGRAGIAGRTDTETHGKDKSISLLDGIKVMEFYISRGSP